MILQSDFFKRGVLFVLSSPSGAGKTTIAKALLERDPNLSLSISKTTRPPRPNEDSGKDYIFTDKESFLKDVENGVFLEHAEVFGNYYGTPCEQIEIRLSQGGDILFDIDWQGAKQIKEKAPSDLVSIFILPPSLEILAERLKGRASDSQDVILRRLNQAKTDISYFSDYDYVLINEDIEKCVQNILVILRAERLKRERHVNLPLFIESMK